MRNRIAAGCPKFYGRILMPLQRGAGMLWLAAALVLPLFARADEASWQGQENQAQGWQQEGSPTESAEAGASHPPLTLLFRGDNPEHAVIMLAGIYNDHEYFLPWRENLAKDKVLLLGWQRSHHVQRLDDSARLLARELIALHEQGILSVTLLAHSIGGLVAKGAVDRLSKEKLAGRFDSIELHAFGTPWGGFPGADLAHTNPLGYVVSYLAGNPAWLDLGTHSSYLAGLAQAMPPNGRLFNYIVEQDEVATPASEAAMERYDNLLQYASASLSMSGADHNAYVQHNLGRLMQFAQQRGSADKVAGEAMELSSGASD